MTREPFAHRHSLLHTLANEKGSQLKFIENSLRIL